MNDFVITSVHSKIGGRLDIVPFLLEVYRNLYGGMFELAFIPVTIARLIAPNMKSEIYREPLPQQLDKYVDLVLQEYHLVVERHDSDTIVVTQGRLRTVYSVAKQIRVLSQEKTNDSSDGIHELRGIFEPATGIDCSAMFNEDGVSLTDARLIAETFLDGHNRSYRKGCRTFFGHRVPSFKAASW